MLPAGNKNLHLTSLFHAHKEDHKVSPTQLRCSCHPSLIGKPSPHLLLFLTVNWAGMQHCLWCKISFLLLCRTLLFPFCRTFQCYILTFLRHDRKICSSILTRSKEQYPLRNCHLHLWTLDIATSPYPQKTLGPSR